MADQELTGEALQEAKRDFMAFIRYIASLSEDELRAKYEAMNPEDRATVQAFTRDLRDVFMAED